MQVHEVGILLLYFLRKLFLERIYVSVDWLMRCSKFVRLV